MVLQTGPSAHGNHRRRVRCYSFTFNFDLFLSKVVQKTVYLVLPLPLSRAKVFFSRLGASQD